MSQFVQNLARVFCASRPNFHVCINLYENSWHNYARKARIVVQVSIMHEFVRIFTIETKSIYAGEML